MRYITTEEIRLCEDRKDIGGFFENDFGESLLDIQEAWIVCVFWLNDRECVPYDSESRDLDKRFAKECYRVIER